MVDVDRSERSGETAQDAAEQEPREREEAERETQPEMLDLVPVPPEPSQPDGPPGSAVSSLTESGERLRGDRPAEENSAEESLAEAAVRKHELLAMLGHELRNPLAAIAHGLELLGQVPDDRSRTEEVRLMMVRQTTRIAALLDQLLDIARVISGRVELETAEVDLADAVRTAVETLRPLLGEHDLTVRVPSHESVLVIGDGVRLTEIVENLLSNAARYTNKGGHIEVTLEAEQDTARITVHDSGSGITAELLPHVFEVFTQAPRPLDRAKGGLGLGLTLVRRLVALHGGQVTAQSPGPDQGSTFVVTLPCRIRRHSAAPRPRLESAPERRATPRRILVVDDEEDTAEVLAELLESQGHEALAVHNGPAALAAIGQFDPEVVLLDLGLPEVDGYEVAAQIRQAFPDRKLLLIAVTGYQKDPVRLERAGFDHHLLKPPSSRKLAALLAELDSTGVEASGRGRADDSAGVST